MYLWEWWRLIIKQEPLSWIKSINDPELLRIRDWFFSKMEVVIWEPVGTWNFEEAWGKYSKKENNTWQ